MKKILTLILLFILSVPAFGMIKLNIVIVTTIGGSKGLVLVSELHESRKVMNNEKISLTTKSDVKAIITTRFKNEKSEVGPSPKVLITCDLSNKNGVLKTFTNEHNLTYLGTPARFIYDDKEHQRIEITIIPESV